MKSIILDLKDQNFYQSFNEYYKSNKFYWIYLFILLLNNQFLKLIKLVDSRQIGMNEWFIPQISEHCPKNNPGRFINNIDWLSRPGVESILIPKEGIVQEWITSIEEVRMRIGKLKGRIHRLSVSRRRNSLGFKSLEGII